MPKWSESMWLALAIIGMIAIGIGSSYYFGNDNPIEQAIEAEAEQFAETEFHLPPGTLKTEFEAIFECGQRNPDGGFHCIEKPKD